MEKTSTTGLGRRNLKQPIQRTILPTHWHSTWQVPQNPHSLLFCSQEPKSKEKTSGWTSLGLITLQKGRGECFNRASQGCIQWGTPYRQNKTLRDKVKGKTRNVHNSHQNYRRDLCLHFRELWGSEHLNNMESKGYTSDQDYTTKKKKDYTTSFHSAIPHSILNYTWSFNINKSNFKALRCPMNEIFKSIWHQLFHLILKEAFRKQWL